MLQNIWPIKHIAKASPRALERAIGSERGCSLNIINFPVNPLLHPHNLISSNAKKKYFTD